MIAEIYYYDHGTVIVPLHNSIDTQDLWFSLYDCGFNSQCIGCHDGYDNSVVLYKRTTPPQNLTFRS